MAAALMLSPALPVAATSRAQSQFEGTGYLLDQAEEARAAGERDKAIRLYGSAIAAYEELVRRHPDFEPELLQFRIAYCRNQIIALRREAASPQPPFPAAQHPAPEAGQTLSRRPLTPPVVQSIAFCRSGQFERAIATLEAYLPLHTDDAVALMVMGTAQLGTGNQEEARRYLHLAIEADPGLAEAHYNLCQLLVRQTAPDFEAARQHYHSAIAGGVERDESLEVVLGIEDEPEPAPQSLDVNR